MSQPATAACCAPPGWHSYRIADALPPTRLAAVESTSAEFSWFFLAATTHTAQPMASPPPGTVAQCRGVNGFAAPFPPFSLTPKARQRECYFSVEPHCITTIPLQYAAN